MTEQPTPGQPRYPLLVALPGGRIQHAAKQARDGYVHTLCGRVGVPTGDGTGLPYCAKCRAKPNPRDSRSYTPTPTTGTA